MIAPCFYDYAAGSTDAAGFVNALSSGLAQAYGVGGSAPTEAEGDEATEEETTEEAAADDTATEETTEETTEEGGSDNE